MLFRGSLQAAWAFYRDSPKDTMDILQKLSSSYHGHGAEGSEQRGSHVEDAHWHALKDSDSIESCDLQNANWVCTHSPLPIRHLSQLASRSSIVHFYLYGAAIPENKLQGVTAYEQVKLVLQYQKGQDFCCISVINVQTIALFNRDMMSNCFTPHEFKNVLNLENPPLLHPNLATIPFLNRRVCAC